VLRAGDRLVRPRDDVLRVREQERGLELERELAGVLRGVDGALGLRLAHGALEQAEPVAEEGDEPVAHRAGPHVQLGERRGEEAPARERLRLDVAEVAVGETAQAGERRRGVGRRLEHLRREDGLGGLDGRELELLLRAEVGEEAALAHADRVCKACDREAAQPLHRREARRLVEDRGPAALAVAAPPAASRLLVPGHAAKVSTIVRASATFPHERSY